MPRFDYPRAERLDVVDELHGHRIPDPYRWLEDASSEQTRAWSEAQDELCRSYLDALPLREHFRRRLKELIAPGLVTVPAVRGSRAFYQRRAGDQEHAVLIVREEDGTERVLIDPAALSDEGTVTLDGWVASKEGDRLAYLLSEGGDEESALRVMDVATGQTIDGPIDRTRYSPVAWLPGGEAFYYVRRLPPDQVPEDERQLHRRVYLHRLGTNADADDELVFGDGPNRDKTEYFDANVSLDGRWLVVWAQMGTAPRNDLYIRDLHDADGGFVTIQEKVDAQTYGSVRDGVLYLFTNLDAPRFRLCVADPERPQPSRWRDLVPESEAVLEAFAVTEDAVAVASTRHAVGSVAIHDRSTGRHLRDVELPPNGTIAGLSSRPDGGHDVWIGYTDFTTPPRVYHFDVSAGSLDLWEDSPGSVDVKAIVTEQVVYPSKDGTSIAMFVVRRDDAEPDGERPTVLYGYGGFNVPQAPAYSAGALAWAELGGVYAIANLRGGSEEGEEWHRAGMRERKQNVFDDFIAAGEWLVRERWTSPQHLGIYGGSNGGLLVGAALTQRPDLFEAVVCSAPLLDMVRYEKFGLGVTWNDEYGTAEKPEELEWLLSYSPYHHVREGVEYPAVLFTVFDSDTRVDPLHARKMCAALQWATASDRPVLIRREVKVGHGARAVSREIELAVDRLAFLAANVGLTVPA